MDRGKAIALAVMIVTTSVSTIAFTGESGADNPHSPIHVVGDGDWAACACIASGTGTMADPFIIEDWRISFPNGVAIEIRDVQKYFVIRDNTLSGRDGIKLINTGDRGTIENNAISHVGKGVRLVNSATLVGGNTILGPVGPFGPYGATGISVDGASPVIDNNHIARNFRGIEVSSASPTIANNQIVENWDGVLLTDSASALMTDNVVRLSNHWGLVVEKSANAELYRNEVREGQGGIVVFSASLYMEANTVINQRKEAVRFEQSVVTMFRNDVRDNWRGAYGSTDSDVLLVENTFINNADAGIRLTRSEGIVRANQLDLNGVGIAIQNSIVTLEDNVMFDNTWGISIPYSSRQSIPLMSGNFINGWNVDGTVNAAQRSIYYKATGVTISGKTFDSGHAQGHFGTTMFQGALIIYDSLDITIEDNVFEFNFKAIHIQNSTLITIRNNVFSNNHIAVFTEWSRVFIKENECDIDIDPPGTACFVAQGGFVVVRANVIAGVDIGIHFRIVDAEMMTDGIIEGNVVTRTRIAIKLEGSLLQTEHDVDVLHNDLQLNVVGMFLIGFRGTIRLNLIANNSWAGVEMENRSNATFIENKVLFNGFGILDIGDCNGDWRSKCSSGHFVRNRVKANAEVGVTVHNGGLFEGDVITHNKFGVDINGRASLHGVIIENNTKVGAKTRGEVTFRAGSASHNGEDGIRAHGFLRVVGTLARHNCGDGIDVVGHALLVGPNATFNCRDGADIFGTADIVHGNFSSNIKVGLRLNGTLFRVRECEIDFNLHGIVMAEALVDVRVGPLPGVPIPDIPVPNIPDINLPDFDDDENKDPLFISQCNIVKNKRFAIKATHNSIVNATFNFWGPDGPRYSMADLVVTDRNVVSHHVLVSPYYKTREHTTIGFVPTTPLGPDLGL